MMRHHPDRNLVLLCAKHHRAVHEGGFTLERDTDHKNVVRRPDGQLLTHHDPHADPAVPIETQHRTYGYGIDANTNECGWEGRTPNISDIISHFPTPQPGQRDQLRSWLRLKGRRRHVRVTVR